MQESVSTTLIRSAATYSPPFCAPHWREGFAMPAITSSSSELELLATIQIASSRGCVTQRELAKSAGLSLGKTNLLLRRLEELGWLAIQRHTPKNVSYVLTPMGGAELSYRNRVNFEEASLGLAEKTAPIEGFISAAKARGAHAAVLVGASALDLILERICDGTGLPLLKSADLGRWISDGNAAYALIRGEFGPALTDEARESGHWLDLGFRTPQLEPSKNAV